jgi:hypothetical protein
VKCKEGEGSKYKVYKIMKGNMEMLVISEIKCENVEWKGQKRHNRLKIKNTKKMRMNIK